jgi:hypothetical protein
VGGVVISRLALAVPHDRCQAVRAFYAQLLGSAAQDREPAEFAFRVGSGWLTFTPADGSPFYHFALLVPGDRFAVAKAWLDGVVDLLTDDAGRSEFQFDSWPASAAYWLDPAGNIVEVIAHPGVLEAGHGDVSFDPREFAGISEAGVVARDLDAAARTLAADAGIDIWDGDLSAGIAFLGRRAHTVILSAPGRGWLPTGRPAEAHPVSITLTDGKRETVIAGDDQGRVWTASGSPRGPAPPVSSRTRPEPRNRRGFA